MNLIDIGVNLTHKQFHKDRDEVLANALDQGVAHMVLTGCSVRGSQEAQAYAAQHRGVLFSTAGVHPHDAKSCNDKTLYHLQKLAQTPEVVAIGECGLDYNRDFSPRDVQRKWFEGQLALARELKMPVFLHERDAHEDFLEILSRYIESLPAAVVHCFTGSQEALEAYLAIGASVGITGWICDERRGKGLRDIVKLIPDDRLMIETDAPFLLPRDLKPKPTDRRNEPRFLGHICEAVATCRDQDPDHVAQITTENAIRFFQLPL